MPGQEEPKKNTSGSAGDKAEPQRKMSAPNDAGNAAAAAGKPGTSNTTSNRPTTAAPSSSRRRSISRRSAMAAEEDNPEFRPFTEATYDALVEREIQAKKEEEMRKKKFGTEGRLIGGELQFAEDSLEEQIDYDPELEENEVIPKRMGYCPKKLIGEPLEEIDTCIRDRTFIAISMRMGKQVIYRFAATDSLFCFKPTNPFRKGLITMTTHEAFDYVILATIVANIIYLSLGVSSGRVAEYIFLAIYTVEAILKIIARGFVGEPYTYLRDGWNVLDFIVVILGYVDLIVYQVLGTDVVNVSGIRTFRLLRFFRNFTAFPSMRVVVNTLLRSFPMTFEVLILAAICLILFGLFGSQLFRGTLRQKCVLNVDYSVQLSDYDDYYLQWMKNPDNWGPADSTQTYTLCSNLTGAGLCTSGALKNTGNYYVCQSNIGENPRWGFESFDNIAWALLATYSVVVLDGWHNQLQDIIATTSPAYVLLYLVLVFFLSFYIINLSVAVIVINFETEAKLSRLGRRRPARKKKKIMYFDSNSDKVKSKRQFEREKRRRSMQVERYEVKTSKEIVEENRRNQMALAAAAIVGNSGVDVRAYQEAQKAEAERLRKQAAMQTVLRKKAAEEKRNQPDVETMSNFDDTASETASTRSGTTTNDSTSDFFNDGADSDTGSIGGEIVVVEAEDDYMEELVDRNCKTCKKDCKPRESFVAFLRFQNRLAEGVTDPLFDLSILLIVLLNVISLAIQFYGQPAEMTTVLYYFNVAVTIVFCLEAFLKIMSLSLFYFKSGWNIFDLIVTLLSVVDVSVPTVNGLSVFRAFRLLRLLKLMESWEAMRLVLEVVFSTIAMIFTVSIIFLIVIVAFALLGFKLYGSYYIPSNFPPDFTVPRYNFVDMMHSMVVIFRIMCNDLMDTFVQCMRCAGSICIIVYFPCIVFGNFMVTNLFLAMIIQAFGNETKKPAPSETLLDLGCRRIHDICCPCECSCPEKEEEVEEVYKEESSVTSEKTDETRIDDDQLVEGDGDSGRGSGSPTGSDEANKGDRPASASNVEVDVKPKGDADGPRIKSPPPRIRSPPPEMRSEDAAGAEAKQSGKINLKVLLSKRNKVVPQDEKLSDDENLDDDRSGSSMSDEDDEEDSEELSAAEAMRQILRKQKMEEQMEAAEYSENQKIIVPDCCVKSFYSSAIDSCRCSRKTEQGKSWYKFRHSIATVAQNKAFDMFIIAIIIISSIELSLEDVYLNEKPDMQTALIYLNLSILVIFVIEMFLKMIADGVLQYFTTGWTLLDFFIVAISLVDTISNFVPNVTSIGALRALRTLRALRPLRAISKVQSMRVVINSLISALPSIAVVGIITLMFWFIFAIMGTQLFSGSFWRCVDSSGAMLPASLVPNITVCASNPNYIWVNPLVNFDNVGQSLLAMMQVATFQGWVDIMNNAVDSIGDGMQPVFENQMAYYVYFLGFVILGVFFSLNLFIGVIVDQFSTQRKKIEGEYLNTMLTLTQKKYVVTFRRLVAIKPSPAARVPESVFRQLFYYISLSQRFETGMIVIIILNALTMCVEFLNEANAFATIVTMLNLMFTSAFTFEMLVKLIGLGQYYFSYGWNIFDFVIVMLSITGSLTELLATNLPINPSLLRVFRIIRVVRILRMMRSARGIRKLIATLVAGMPSLANIAILLFLLMYIFSVIAMQLFGYVQNNGAITDIVNFRTFYNAFLIMFQILTASGWNDIYASLWINSTVTNCNSVNATLPDGYVVVGAVGGSCGLFGWPAFIICIYLILGRFILLNMYIAVILENYARAQEQEEIKISQEDVEYFFSSWERFDPAATEYIRVEQLSDFCDELEQPFRLPKPNMIKIVALDIPISEGEKVHCLDIARAVISNVLGAVEDTPEFKVIMEDLEEQFKDTYPNRYATQIISSTRKRKKEEIAAKTLQAAWIRHKKRRQVSEQARMRKLGKKPASQTAHLINNVQRVKPPSGTIFGSQTSLHESSINLSKSSLEMRNLPLNTTVSVGNLYQATLRKIKENLKPLPKDAVTPIYSDDMRVEDVDLPSEKPTRSDSRRSANRDA